MDKRRYRFALGFFVTIFVFAVVYSLMGSSHWNTEHPVTDFWSALYFSVVSITTLGFGDMFPVSGIARFMVCAECVIGLVLMGLFLNDISALQADKVSKAERGKSEEEIREKEVNRYRIRFNALRRTIDMFKTSAYLLTTPMDKRADEIPTDLSKHHFTFNDLHDFNQPNLLITQDYMEKTIEFFLRCEERLYDELTDILKNIDGDYLDGVNTIIESITNDIDNNNFTKAIEFQLRTKSQDGKTMASVAAEVIKNYKDGDEMNERTLQYPYYCIYTMLQRVLPRLGELDYRSKQLIALIKKA